MEARVSRLEEDMRDIRPLLVEIRASQARIEAIFPHLATKADVADLRAEMEHRFSAAQRVFEERFSGMDQRLAGVDQRLAGVDQRFSQVDQRLAQADQQLVQVDQRLAQVDQRFSQVDQRFSQVDQRFSQVDQRFSRIDTKLADLEVKLADKPGKTYMWGILGVLLTAYACGLAALAILK